MVLQLIVIDIFDEHLENDETLTTEIEVKVETDEHILAEHQEVIVYVEDDETEVMVEHTQLEHILEVLLMLEIEDIEEQDDEMDEYDELDVNDENEGTLIVEEVEMVELDDVPLTLDGDDD